MEKNFPFCCQVVVNQNPGPGGPATCKCQPRPCFSPRSPRLRFSVWRIRYFHRALMIPFLSISNFLPSYPTVLLRMDWIASSWFLFRFLDLDSIAHCYNLKLDSSTVAVVVVQGRTVIFFYIVKTSDQQRLSWIWNGATVRSELSQRNSLSAVERREEIRFEIRPFVLLWIAGFGMCPSLHSGFSYYEWWMVKGRGKEGGQALNRFQRSCGGPTPSTDESIHYESDRFPQCFDWESFQESLLAENWS